MKTTYIINKDAIIMFVANKPVRIEKTSKKYPKLLEVFNLPEDEQDAAIVALVNQADSVATIHGQEGFEVVGEDIYYKGEKLDKVHADKVRSILEDGLPVKHFEAFWENIQLNPSSSSVRELLDFLGYKELPITVDGHFIAYKGTQVDGYSIHGNTDTKVLQGTVNSSGQLRNLVGDVIEVERNNVEDNRNVHCGPGVHAGSLTYASGFGQKVVVVKIHPRDVVSVPVDCQCQKLRCCKYEVIAEFEQEIEASVVDDSAKPIAIPEASERNKFIDRVDKYLSNKMDDGYETVTLRQLQNAFSPEYPSKVKVFDALQTLGYDWEETETGSFEIILG